MLALALAGRQAPALSPALLETGVTGTTQLEVLPAMYDRGAYLFQTGFGYLNADLLALDTGPPADLVLATARLARARALLRESLLHDPANAHAWQAYAESAAALGAFAEARSALAASARLAPANVELALARLYLSNTLKVLARYPPEARNLTPAQIRTEATRIANDRAVLATHAPALLASLPEGG